MTIPVDVDYISAVGLCGVFGYEAEVNHTIGLCREARTDHHLLLTVAKCRTHTYTVRNKNRLMYACLTANIRWFRTLFRMTGKTDIVSVRTRENETLYHLVCTLPVPTHKISNTYKSDNNPFNKVPERIQILNTLLATNIDTNVKTNTNQQIAFDIVAEDTRLFFGVLNSTFQDYIITLDQCQLIRWWLDRMDRLDPENLNRYLPWLAFYGRLEAVQHLCRMEHMNINIESAFGRTALFLAANEGHTSVVKELLSYYPHRLTATDLNHQDSDGYTALHFACQYDHLDIVQSLCRLPVVELNLATQDEETPLTIGASFRNAAVVEELLSYYPHRLTATDLNHQNKNGYTALRSAYNDLDIVQSLCRLPGILPSLRNVFGETPLSIAAEEGRLEIIEILLQGKPTDGDVEHAMRCASRHYGWLFEQIDFTLCEYLGIDSDLV